MTPELITQVIQQQHMRPNVKWMAATELFNTKKQLVQISVVSSP